MYSSMVHICVNMVKILIIEDKYSQLIQYEILKKMVTFIYICGWNESYHITLFGQDPSQLTVVRKSVQKRYLCSSGNCWNIVRGVQESNMVTNYWVLWDNTHTVSHKTGEFTFPKSGEF